MTTFYWVGTEDTDFAIVNGGGGVITSGSGTNYRSSFTRCGMSSGDNNSVADPPFYRIASPLWSSAVSSFWFHTQVCFRQGGASITGDSNFQVVRFLDAAGVCRLGLRCNGSNQLKLFKRTAAGTITDIATSSTVANFGLSINALDMQVVYNSSGSVTVYHAGVQILTFSGDMTTDGATTLQQVELGNAGSIAAAVYSECIVSDSDTRAMALQVLTSSTAGTTQSWTGTASNVNQTTVNDANYVYSATANQLQEYKPAALVSGNYNVLAVAMIARALVGSSGPSKMDFVTRIATTEYLSSDYSPSVGSFNNFGPYIQTTNPATSVAFTTADLVSTNFQYGLKSIT